MYQKNELLSVEITDIGNDGEGIGKCDGYTLFVKDAVVGDVVRARITKPKKNYAYARVEEIITSSPFRVTPPCPICRQCGGCQLQPLSYEQQLQYKERKVRGHLRRIGGFDEALLNRVTEPIVGMSEPYRYRNKAQYPFGTARDGSPAAGFYAGRTHTIIPGTDCLLGVPENREVLEAVLAYMKENHVAAYDETSGKGLIRHVLIRKGFSTGQMMVCVVINGRELPFADRLVGSLRTIKNMTSVSHCINTEDTNVIMGTEVVGLWGTPTITDSIRIYREDLCEPDGREVTFCISPLSFYQVNPRQTEKLYSLALAYAGLTGKEVVWDLYCGIGTISLFLAGDAKQVYGVEVVPQAIEDARENARRNGITNAEFFVGKAEEVLPQFYEDSAHMAGTEKCDGMRCADGETEKHNGTRYADEDVEKHDGMRCADGDAEKRYAMRHPDVIVVDPPRKGCDAACLQTMLAMQPKRIVYVSCDSATLARDLRILADGGYELMRVRPVDMFPQTVHCETVALLSHKAPDSTVDITVEFGEGEGKVPPGNIDKRAEAYKPKEKVTYEMIQEYVEDKYGFKVHTAYIAEVKRGLGLPMYDAPNAVEELKHPRKHPTAEKVEAIKEALRYFEII